MAIVAARSARTRPEEDWFDLGAVGFEVQRPWLRGALGLLAGAGTTQRTEKDDCK